MAVNTSTQSKSQTASLKESTASFEYYSPKARSVSVAGDFNKWNASTSPLTKDYQGTWKASIKMKPGRYQYRFFVDGQWMDDPKAKESVPNGFGSKNAVLTVK